jgi:hypothetical protein
MIRRVAVRLIPVIAIIVGAAQLACAPRLEEAQVRARLVDQLRLSKDELRVVSIDSAAQPVATIEYAGIRAGVRFRRQDGVWVIDAVEQEGRFEPADRAVPVLARRLSEKAHARWIESVMPRYARTLKLLIGWTDLLATDCSSGLPTSQTALVNLHAVWHRVLFPNRGGEFHNMDLFLRDAWWKPFRVTLTARRVEVQSSGADGQMDTPDDLRMTYARTPIRSGVTACLPHYTLPAAVVEALSRPDAPTAWNCAELLSSLRRNEMLDVAQAGR